ncbi:hypothetical protein KY345_05425 [Candidatus Woesearchaeota archaeon]|nr:hypothetical protein [Candidatus Woesearchaeota archaeon]
MDSMIEGRPILEVSGLKYKVNELFVTHGQPEPICSEVSEGLEAGEEKGTFQTGIKVKVVSLLIEDCLGFDSVVYSRPTDDGMRDQVDIGEDDRGKEIRFENDESYEKRRKNTEESSLLSLITGPDTPTQEEFLRDLCARAPNNKQIEDISYLLQAKDTSEVYIGKLKITLGGLFGQTNDITQIAGIRLGEIVNAKRQSPHVLGIGTKIAESANRTYEELVMRGQTYTEGETLISCDPERRCEDVLHRRYILSNFASQLIEDVPIRGRPGATYHYLPGIDDIMMEFLIERKLKPLVEKLNRDNSERYTNWKRTKKKNELVGFTQDIDTGKMVEGDDFFLDKVMFEDYESTLEKAPDEVVDLFYEKNPIFAAFFSEFRGKFKENMRYHISRFEGAVGYQLLAYGLKDPRRYKRPKEIVVEKTENGIEHIIKRNGRTEVVIGEYYRGQSRGNYVKATAELMHKQNAGRINRKEPIIGKKVAIPALSIAGISLLGWFATTTFMGLEHKKTSSQLKEKTNLVQTLGEEKKELEIEKKVMKEQIERKEERFKRVAFKKYGIPLGLSPVAERNSVNVLIGNLLQLYHPENDTIIKDLTDAAKMRLSRNYYIAAYLQTGKTDVLKYYRAAYPLPRKGKMFDSLTQGTNVDTVIYNKYIALIDSGGINPRLFGKARVINEILGPIRLKEEDKARFLRKYPNNRIFWRDVGVNHNFGNSVLAAEAQYGYYHHRIKFRRPNP